MYSYLVFLSLAFSALTLPTLGLPGVAHAEESASPAQAEVKAYAIIIGNNAGGPGQEDLHYAEADARRVSALLLELGGYQFQEPLLLLSPSPMQLWNSFEGVQQQLIADHDRGQDSVLFFYYSGHARAEALDLGDTQIELSDLRARIEAMPASLRVVILDACQSGAISRVKGAKAAADFSTSSIASLRMQGLAIMASSSAAELSQESDALEGSYFTHHLLSGLRGAADENRDGSVTLSEAYSYAYDSTLLATALSAVGKQHVTLETDLRGKGDVALTRPADADAKLVLPAAWGGAVTISHRKNVVAEVSKVAGQSTTIALPTGNYSVILRENKSARKCQLELHKGQSATLRWKACSAMSIDAGVSKGSGHGLALVIAEPAFVPHWNLEVNFGLRGPATDAYTERLETFGYEGSDDFLSLEAHYNVKAYRSMGPHLQLGGSMGRLESDHYHRHTDGASTYDLTWKTSHLSALARLYQSFDGDHQQAFVEASLGLSRASSTLVEQEMDRVSSEIYYGFALSGSVGFLWKPFAGVGVVSSIGYSYAPTLKNELGEAHSGAGLLSSLGLCASF